MGIADVRETISSCKHCFMCRHACPTFLATKLDSHTPRGYALLLAEIEAGKADWSDAIVDRFYQCSQCGLCREDCAYHWPEDEMVRHAREEIVAAGRAPERVGEIARSFIEGGNPGTAGTPPSGTGRAEKPGAEILYYPGWSARANQPAAVESVRSILARLTTEWAEAGDETDTGVSLYELGYTKEAVRQATAVRDRIANLNPRRLVTGCPHTLWAFRKLYDMLGVAMPAGIEFLHTSELLVELIEKGALPPFKRADLGTVAYHDPCRLGRALGVYEAPRRLIEMATGTPPVELFHSRQAAECCGAGSGMFLTDPQVSLEVARRRLAAAADEGVQTLITACPNCGTLLNRVAGDGQTGITILDIAELAAGRL